MGEMITRTMRWQTSDAHGLEHASISEGPTNIVARSVIVGHFNNHVHGTHYELVLSPAWEFRSLALEQTDGRRLSVSRDGQNWLINDQREPAFNDCIDIDLSATPLTNTLPIRRCEWENGQDRQFKMVFIPFDTLVPIVDGQIYNRISPTTFIYRATDGSFERTITVDDDGFVVEYPGLFSRLEAI